MTRLFSQALTVTAAALLGATAIQADNHFERIAGHASKVETESRQMSLALKSKKADPADITRALQTTGAEIASLKELVSQIEASNPSFTERDRKDWEMLKTKVQLLSIFHDRKKELTASEFSKQRSLIRAHAEGLAKRAALLQQTASRLRAVNTAQAGS